MPLFGIDVSHHQGPSLDFAAMRREGVEFAILKATEGSGFVDSQFSNNLRKARNSGMLVAAYHYVRSNVNAASQVANIVAVVPRDVPVIPDVEANSGGVLLVRDLVTRLREAGYKVPLLYLPRWYWQQIGSPSLTGLPPLWSSRYPDNVVDSLANEYADVPSRYWDGYGGLGVAVLQFTSSARIAGRSPLDGNAYNGTRAQLAQLFGYSAPKTEDDVKYILAKNANGSDIWLGNLMTRRRVRDMDELGGLQHWLRQTGNGSPDVVDEWHDLDVLGVDVNASKADVDEAALATAVIPALSEALKEVLGEDNNAQAQAILDAMAERLKGSPA